MITRFKLFESEDELKLGKYVIYKFPTNLIILEVISIENATPRTYGGKWDYNITMKRLYTVYSSGRIDKSIKDDFDFKWSEIKDRIVYDSDDLEEVLDVAPTILDVNKYNL